MSTYPKTIESVMQASKLIVQAGKLLTDGGGDYNLEKLGEYARALFDRFAPFKVGDRVLLTSTPRITIEKNRGWMGAKHWLVAGIVGTVTDVDYRNGAFYALVLWDDQTWKNSDTGEVHPLTREDWANFTHSERSLARYAEGHDGCPNDCDACTAAMKLALGSLMRELREAIKPGDK